MKDENGQLILSLISHQQLFIGSSVTLFKLPFKTYQKWVDINWVTSIWWFTSSLGLVLDIEDQWLPRLTRENDAMLMDIALQFNFTIEKLRQINLCRLYLQVLSIADITAANGRTLLQEVIQGSRVQHHTSSLHWPSLQRPSNWSAWRILLQHLVQGNTLKSPFGKWIDNPHQQWEWFYNPTNDILYQCQSSAWKSFQRAPARPVRSRRSQTIFLSTPSICSPVPSTSLYPATVCRHNNCTLMVLYSSSQFPSVLPSPSNFFWNLANIPPVFNDTPNFYQHLIGPHPPTQQACEAIKDAITTNALMSCSDGSHCPRTHHGSHGWVFNNQNGEQLSRGSGPTDGHPSMLSSYRAGLGGILASLYIIHRICSYFHIEIGQAVLYCDNKGAINKAFQKQPLGITPFLTTDYDLIHLAQTLIQLIPITTMG